MKISEDSHFVQAKHFVKFRDVSDKNDGVMMSSKLRRDGRK